jgi:hypothetical protein
MIDYTKIADEHLAKLTSLREQKEQIEQDIKATTEMIRAAVNMMPEDDKAKYARDLQQVQLKEIGLTGAIRSLLQQNSRVFLAPLEIRDILQQKGFDFSAYTSNPLISIHSILKRFKPSEVEKKLYMDGVTGYRWKKAKKKTTVPFFGNY